MFKKFIGTVAIGTLVMAVSLNSCFANSISVIDEKNRININDKEIEILSLSTCEIPNLDLTIKSLINKKINEVVKKLGSYSINFSESETPEVSIIISETRVPINDENKNNTTSNVLKDNQEFINKVAELTNAERAKYELEPLTLNTDLCKAAQSHVEDMYNKNYFSHESLSGETVKDRIDKYSNGFSYYAENIAYGQTTAEEVVEAWMNSESHKANILGNYKQIGIGFYNNYWCQDFTD